MNIIKPGIPFMPHFGSQQTVALVLKQPLMGTVFKKGAAAIPVPNTSRHAPTCPLTAAPPHNMKLYILTLVANAKEITRQARTLSNTCSKC